MITVLVMMTAGIAIGVISRKKPYIIKTNERLVSAAIYLLLFLLGVSVGTNKQVISSLHNLGLEALLITLGATMGSILMCYLIYRFIFKPEDSDIRNEK